MECSVDDAGLGDSEGLGERDGKSLDILGDILEARLTEKTTGLVLRALEASELHLREIRDQSGSPG